MAASCRASAAEGASDLNFHLAEQYRDPKVARLVGEPSRRPAAAAAQAVAVSRNTVPAGPISLIGPLS